MLSAPNQNLRCVLVRHHHAPVPEREAAPRKKSGSPDVKNSTNTAWYKEYLGKHPESDTNGDGIIGWAEVSAHKKKNEP